MSWFNKKKMNEKDLEAEENFEDILDEKWFLFYYNDFVHIKKKLFFIFL